MEAARPATVDDLEAIESILAGLVPALMDQRGGPVLLAGEVAAMRPVAELVDDPDAVVIVGTYDDVVFGVGTMRMVDLADGRRIGRIDRLAVDAEARGSGIGEAIMNALLDECRERGAKGIESMALPGDRETKNFFESFGVKARLLVVMREFD